MCTGQPSRQAFGSQFALLLDSVTNGHPYKWYVWEGDDKLMALLGSLPCQCAICAVTARQKIVQPFKPCFPTVLLMKVSADISGSRIGL